MADPHAAAFGGQHPGDYEFSNYLRQIGGPQFWQELVDYQGRRTKAGPRPGYNYRTKKERDPDTAADIQNRLNALYDYWRSRGWSPLEDEVMRGKEYGYTDPLVDEAERLSGKK